MNTKLLNDFKILTLFVRSFGFLQGACLRPSEVVQVVRRAMDDWPATPQGSKRTTKTENHVISEYKNMKNEANLNSLKFTASPCGTGGYNASHPKTKNGTKPNEANLKPIPNTTKPSPQTGNSALFKTLLLRNKPNFNSLKFTASPCTTVIYNDLQPKTQNGANPNKPNFRQVASKPWRRRRNTGITRLFSVLLAAHPVNALVKLYKKDMTLYYVGKK